MPRRSLLALSAALLLSFPSCRSTGGQGLRAVYVTNTKKISLLPPECMDGTKDEVSLFTGEFGRNSFSAIAWLSADKDGISVVLMNDFGVSLGTLSYDGETVSFSSAFFPEKLRAEYIVADLQNAWYDAAALRAQYRAAGLSFTAERGADGAERRTVRNGGTVIEEIVRTADGAVSIRNHLRGYRYDLSAPADG